MAFVTKSVTGVVIFFCVQVWPVSQHWRVDQVRVHLVAGVDAGLGEQFCKGGEKNQTMLHCKAECRPLLAAVVQPTGARR